MPAQRIGAPHTAQLRSGAAGAKPLHGLAQKGHLPFEAGASIADREMNAQGDALAEAEAAVEAPGHQVACLLARKHH
jgi:hypothetical protein